MTIQTEQQQIAQTIREQITPGVLMSLGAHNQGYIKSTDEVRGGYRFAAIILPFNKNGERSVRARNMTVVVELTWADTYTVTVRYPTKGGAGPYAIHFEREGVYCDQLAKLLLALDYDGDEVLNPRYV